MPTTIRTRRLTNDYERVLSDLAGSEFVKVKPIAGSPPNHYRVTYLVSGLMSENSGETTKPVTRHEVDIVLPIGYPKQSPRCTMITPIWHPNIGDYICIGDYWSAGVPLVDIIVHIGDMIQYKNYNLRSPVNKTAAAWAERNIRSFPVGNRSLLPGDRPDSSALVVIDIPEADDLGISLGPVRER